MDCRPREDGQLRRLVGDHAVGADARQAGVHGRTLATTPLTLQACGDEAGEERVGPEVVTGWKSGDAASTATLASLELDELGLRSLSG